MPYFTGFCPKIKLFDSLLKVEDIRDLLYSLNNKFNYGNAKAQKEVPFLEGISPTVGIVHGSHGMTGLHAIPYPPNIMNINSQG